MAIEMLLTRTVRNRASAPRTWMLVSAIAGEYQSPQRQPSTAAIHRKKESVMSKQEEAGLILKLYELRREATMRQARDWNFLDFNPQPMADFTSAMFSTHSGHLRMVITQQRTPSLQVGFYSFEPGTSRLRP